MFEARNRHFAIDAAAVGAWRARDPVAAAFYDSLSALFPQGERFFIESVRAWRDRADGPLADDVAQFIAQEAIHTREHQAFNGQAAAAGRDMAPLEARTGRSLEAVRCRGDLRKLGATVSLEHFTALLAHELVVHPAHLAAAPDETRRLWLWHAAEEIEHKAVAFDLLSVALRDWPAWRRWAWRSFVFVDTMARLARVVVANYRDLRRAEAPGASALGELARLLLVRPGLLRRMAPALAAFFLPGFHPWRRNDAPLIEAALAA
jgi:predicted metal-dependent hydrolase